MLSLHPCIYACGDTSSVSLFLKLPEEGIMIVGKYFGPKYILNKNMYGKPIIRIIPL